jgi:hypothetical protein
MVARMKGKEENFSEKTFRRALAWRKLVFRLVELVNRSKEKDCEDLVSSAMMCIGEMVGCVVLPQCFLLTGRCPEGLCWVGCAYVSICISYVGLV